MSTLLTTPARFPDKEVITGRYVNLERFDSIKHSVDLWNNIEFDDNLWTFMFYGPFQTKSQFDDHLQAQISMQDRVLYAVIDKNNNQAQGLIGLKEISLIHRRIQIAHVTFTKSMQRSAKSTEAVFLIANEAFQLGNRRLEWQTSNANEASKIAALRYGFKLETVFRQDMILKGSSRDSAWYSILDSEWPALKVAFESWLSDDNQGPNGQIKKLQQFMEAI